MTLGNSFQLVVYLGETFVLRKAVYPTSLWEANLIKFSFWLIWSIVFISLPSCFSKLSALNNEASSDEIQAVVFAIGKKLEYENLREWFKGLYETVLGQTEGPRMGSFIKLYGIEPTIKLLENVILGNLVKE